MLNLYERFSSALYVLHHLDKVLFCFIFLKYFSISVAQINGKTDIMASCISVPVLNDGVTTMKNNCVPDLLSTDENPNNSLNISKIIDEEKYHPHANKKSSSNQINPDKAFTQFPNDDSSANSNKVPVIKTQKLTQETDKTGQTSDSSFEMASDEEEKCPHLRSIDELFSTPPTVVDSSSEEEVGDSNSEKENIDELVDFQPVKFNPFPPEVHKEDADNAININL